MKSIKIILIMLSGLWLAACNNSGQNSGYTGTLEGTDVQVPAMTGGQIMSMAVATGDHVEKDQLLAVVDTIEIALQSQQLQAALEEIEAGKAMAIIREQQAKNDLNYITEKEQRTKLLLENKSIARQQYDDVHNALGKMRAAYNTARQNLQTLNAKREQVQAQLSLLKKKRSDAVITSPISGTVSNTYYETGEAAMPMSPVVEVIALDPIEVKIFISEMKLAEISIGQEAKLSVDGTGEEFSGKVIWISPKAEFTPKNIMTEETRTSLVYAVKIRAANPDGVLKHGMPVVVHLL